VRKLGVVAAAAALFLLAACAGPMENMEETEAKITTEIIITTEGSIELKEHIENGVDWRIVEKDTKMMEIFNTVYVADYFYELGNNSLHASDVLDQIDEVDNVSYSLFSPNRRYYALHAQDGSARVYDLELKKCLFLMVFGRMPFYLPYFVDEHTLYFFDSERYALEITLP